MPMSINAMPYEHIATPPEEPAPKRQKTLACLRCRRRKQKCDEQRPCSNCSRSGETCQEVVSRLGLGSNSALQLSQMSLVSPVDFVALEERVARLEKAQLGEQSQSRATSAQVQSRSDVAAGQGASPGGSVSSSLHFQPPERQQQQSRWQQQHQQNPGRPSPLVFSDHGASTGSPFAEPSPSLAGSAPAIGLLATFARSEDEHHRHATASASAVPPIQIDRAVEDAIFNIYRAKVHSQYAFLRLDKLRELAGRRGQDQQQQQYPPWMGFFLNMIYSIGLLLARPGDLPSPSSGGGAAPFPQELQQRASQLFYYRLAVTRHLGHVFAHPDRVLHAQAHLLLAMHALHSPSTERIISIAGATMRYCVMAQLHLAEAEEDGEEEVGAAGEENDRKRRLDRAENEIQGPSSPSSPAMRAQMRRRVFWSAYALDRAVGAMFDLPCSVADHQITTRIYANVDDEDLEAFCAERPAPGGDESISGQRQRSSYAGPVSTALHLVHCRSIQSEILNMTLHREFASFTGGEGADPGSTDNGRFATWQARILDRLERWRAMCHELAARERGGDGGSTAAEGLLMEYHHILAMLYRPRRPLKKTTSQQQHQQQQRDVDHAFRAAQAWAQTCLAFHPLQKASAATEPWLGLVAQFKSGVALVHHAYFFPPAGSAAAAHSAPLLPKPHEVSEAVRACAATLSVLAERWPQARCLRDTFALLVAQTPISDVSGGQGNAGTIRSLLSAVESVVVHRDTLQMIREMATATAERSLRPPPRDSAAASRAVAEKERDERTVGADQEEEEEEEEDAYGVELGLKFENTSSFSRRSATPGLMGDPPSEQEEPPQEEEGESIYVGGIGVAIGAGDAFRPATPEFFLPDLEEHHHHDISGGAGGCEQYDYLDLGFSTPVDPALQF